MLNTKKLLYILPDLTYLAELLPGKKEHEHSIQSFRQINGEFIDDNEFISNNIQKLFTKIDKEEYYLILPDFLFTNTIVNVEEDSKDKAKAHVEEKLLPTLNLNNETHEIEITVLTSFKGNSKVQISAIEKELLAPIRTAAEQSKVTIKAISPLSWTIKSIVSLEPSITVLQIGTNLYSAQHYIGIDQTNNFPVDEFTSITETIKTLKGAEPSIQTIYLASSSLIEEKLKKDLGSTLPIQQLATYKEDDSKMPSYVKYIIESCMKTISIKDFPVPRFSLGKMTDVQGSKEETKEKPIANLPMPSKTVVMETPNMPAKEIEEIKTKIEIETETKEEPTKLETAVEKSTEVNLSQFAGKEDEDKKEPEEKSVKIKTAAKVIKNSSGVNNMLKMVFITLAVFFITIAIGIGVGLGLLKISDKSPEEASPVVVTEPTATPEASATPTPEPEVEINKEEISILIVNATTKAGYAGKIKTLLIEGEISDVKAGNAEGDYEDGSDYVLMLEENEALIKLLEETTELDLEFNPDIEIEDSGSNYDAVIVLAK